MKHLYLFKIQANMNKAHRDRVAFMRICSGKYESSMEVKHVQGNRVMRLSQPQQIMADSRKILDEELYGLDQVKQRIIETIIQINRTHTLPAYGILLIGPAGTGKSQIAYAVAKILRMPWTTLEMSSINDPEQLTGSSRIYANAKPGLIMEAFANAESSNLLFIINELDKACSGKGNGKVENKRRRNSKTG